MSPAIFGRMNVLLQFWALGCPHIRKCPWKADEILGVNGIPTVLGGISQKHVTGHIWAYERAVAILGTGLPTWEEIPVEGG